jgi:superfamily II DNA or RNA helicase
LLLGQWYHEIRKDIPGATILKCGDGDTRWKSGTRLKSLTSVNDSGLGTIVLAVSDTASKAEFLENIGTFSNTLLVADEAHSLGSPKNSSIIEKEFGFRLGLSATPKRYGDPEGTAKLNDFFERTIVPIVTIKDAINAKRLVNYRYFPRSVPLNSEELREWNKLTRQILSKYRSRNELSGSNIDDDVKKLLIRRSRIAKKAEQKIQIARDIVREFYSKDEFWLIYCEDNEQLSSLNELLKNDEIFPYIYTTTLDGSPNEELSTFSENGGIMLAIRCLDEGVDIPKISHAIVLSTAE